MSDGENPKCWSSCILELIILIIGEDNKTILTLFWDQGKNFCAETDNVFAWLCTDI